MALARLSRDYPACRRNRIGQRLEKARVARCEETSLIAGQPASTGRWLLGITTAGLVAYGFYEILHARFLRIRKVT